MSVAEMIPRQGLLPGDNASVRHLPAASWPNTAALAGMWLGRTQSELQVRISWVYWRSKRASASLSNRLDKKLQDIRERHPLPALALISGSAFVLGLIVGIVRSRRR